MIEWRAEGLLLAVRPIGEADAILDVLTDRHGRHRGVVRGGAGRRMAPILQPGARLALDWRARLESQIGHFTAEPVRSRAGLLADRDALAGLGALTALLTFALPERDPQPGLLDATEAVIALMEAGGDWPVAYLRWELVLLERLGFGLDLGTCAVTGATEGLAYISPRSGRAVTEAGAGEWADRLLSLSPALTSPSAERRDILTGLAVTGHFLDARLTLGDRPLPAARARLIERLSR